MEISKDGSAGDKSKSIVPGKELILISNLEIHPPNVTFADMTQTQKEFAFEIAEHAFKLMVKGEKRYFKDLAEFVKKAFDEKFQGTWHVIVGKKFFINQVQTLVLMFPLSQNVLFIFGSIKLDFSFINLDDIQIKYDQSIYEDYILILRAEQILDSNGVNIIFLARGKSIF